jgi:hypothetical protein
LCWDELVTAAPFKETFSSKVEPVMSSIEPTVNPINFTSPLKVALRRMATPVTVAPFKETFPSKVELNITKLERMLALPRSTSPSKVELTISKVEPMVAPTRSSSPLTRLQRFATGFKKIAGGGPNGMADFRDF